MYNNNRCDYCGTINATDYQFCMKCGKILHQQGVPQKINVYNQNSYTGMAPQGNISGLQRSMMTNTSENETRIGTKEKKAGIGLFIGVGVFIGIVLLAVCLICIKLFWFSGAKTRIEEEDYSVNQHSMGIDTDANESENITGENLVSDDTKETVDELTSNEPEDNWGEATMNDGESDEVDDELEYTMEEISSAAQNYCSLVYCISNPSVKIKSLDNKSYSVSVYANIDGHSGWYGDMTIDKHTGLGMGCRGEKADVFHVENTTLDVYYILPYSNSRYIDESDLNNLSPEELTLARNEIYARHGRIFKDEDIRDYFSKQVWYAGIVAAADFDESVFSKVERTNISTIKDYEEKLEKNGFDYSDLYYYDYIIPDSSTRKLSGSDINWMDAHTLMLARNEIYARHGRKFNDKEIREYFESKAWYMPYIEPDDFSEDMLSSIEKENIALIKSYEQ
ncbi:MAG: YARHG domain-containing protein [Coprococcus sp.]|nr:YARHG domain-containing protein [Coprococcus sp.]